MWVKNLGIPPPQKFGGPKTSKFRILRFDRECLRTGTRYRTCISTHSIDFFGRSYLSSYLRGYGALPPENFYFGRGWPTLANAHLIGDGSAPNNFLLLKFENWPKIWCTLADIVGICWGNCIKLSYLMCPLRGIKRPHLILGVLLPKNFGGEKRSFPQRHFATLLQMSAHWNKTSLSGKRLCKVRSLPYTPTKFGELWSTNGENGTVFQPTHNQLLRT